MKKRATACNSRPRNSSFHCSTRQRWTRSGQHQQKPFINIQRRTTKGRGSRGKNAPTRHLTILHCCPPRECNQTGIYCCRLYARKKGTTLFWAAAGKKTRTSLLHWESHEQWCRALFYIYAVCSREGGTKLYALFAHAARY